MHEDFFVLWRDDDGGAQRDRLRVLVVGLTVLCVLLGGGLVWMQQTVAEDARFEYGTTRDYTGVLVGDPVPLLVTNERTWFLVDPLKYGFDETAQRSFTGQRVQLRATLIERGRQGMLEVVAGSVEQLGDAGAATLPIRVSVGEGISLRGEIVDTKCWLGVMNPGHLKPHRACAVNCLRGGIPPVLLSRDENGQTRQVVLVSGDGQPLNEWILPFVAEPVEVTGAMSRLAGLEILEIGAGSVHRLP